MAWQFILNGLAAGSVYALVALAVALQYRTTGFLNFGHGALIAIGAYLAYYLHYTIGVPLMLAAALAVIVTSICGGLTQSLIYSPLQRKGAPSTVLLIASLGVYTVFENAISLAAGVDLKTLIGNPVGKMIFGARLSPIQIASIIFSIAVFLIFWWITRFTLTGKQWRAVGMDRELARAHGIRLQTVDWSVAGISGAVGALAGILIAADVGLMPTIGFRALLMGVVAAVIGGLLTPKAAYLGGLTVGLVQYLVAGLISTRWQDAGVFTLLLFFLIVRPKGFMRAQNGA